MTPKLEKI